MKVLVIANLEEQAISPATLNVISAASEISSEVDLLIYGFEVSKAIEQAKQLPFIQQVLYLDQEILAHPVVEDMTQTVVNLARNYTHVLTSACSLGKSLLPRVAALLDVMQVSDVMKIIDHETFERPIYAGNAIATVKSIDPIKLMTVRSTKFSSLELLDAAKDISVKELDFIAPKSQLSKYIGVEGIDSDGPDLLTAKTIVSGGKGLGSRDNFFKLLSPLAEKLHAAIGASRSAVDLGFCSNDLQVGQTGKVVAPDLYFALGISGAIQHEAGMKDSKVIVAINHDADAAIFKLADYGLVADINSAIPELTDKLP